MAGKGLHVLKESTGRGEIGRLDFTSSMLPAVSMEELSLKSMTVALVVMDESKTYMQLYLVNVKVQQNTNASSYCIIYKTFLRVVK